MRFCERPFNSICLPPSLQDYRLNVIAAILGFQGPIPTIEEFIEGKKQ